MRSLEFRSAGNLGPPGGVEDVQQPGPGEHPALHPRARAVDHRQGHLGQPAQVVAGEAPRRPHQPDDGELRRERRRLRLRRRSRPGDDGRRRDTRPEQHRRQRQRQQPPPRAPAAPRALTRPCPPEVLAVPSLRFRPMCYLAWRTSLPVISSSIRAASSSVSFPVGIRWAPPNCVVYGVQFVAQTRDHRERAAVARRGVGARRRRAGGGGRRWATNPGSRRPSRLRRAGRGWRAARPRPGASRGGWPGGRNKQRRGGVRPQREVCGATAAAGGAPRAVQTTRR